MLRLIGIVSLLILVLIVSASTASAAVTTYSYSGSAIAITDNGTFTSTLNISDSYSISDMNVNLNITHTFVGDLIVKLTSPTGTTVTIIDRPGRTTSGFGCGNNDITTTIDDEAASPVENACPPTGSSYSPNNPLGAFDGQNVNGTWTLTVSDNAGGDTGTINAWSLGVDGASAAPAPVVTVAAPPAPFTPSIMDGRENMYDIAAPAVVYCVTGAINVYDNVDSVGVLVINATQEEVDAVGVPQEQHALVEASADGSIRLYRLTTGEFQVNADANDVNDAYVFIWTASCVTDSADGSK